MNIAKYLDISFYHAQWKMCILGKWGTDSEQTKSSWDREMVEAA